MSTHLVLRVTFKSDLYQFEGEWKVRARMESGVVEFEKYWKFTGTKHCQGWWWLVSCRCDHKTWLGWASEKHPFRFQEIVQKFHKWTVWIDIFGPSMFRLQKNMKRMIAKEHIITSPLIECRVHEEWYFGILVKCFICWIIVWPYFPSSRLGYSAFIFQMPLHDPCVSDFAVTATSSITVCIYDSARSPLMHLSADEQFCLKQYQVGRHVHWFFKKTKSLWKE